MNKTAPKKKMDFGMLGRVIKCLYKAYPKLVILELVCILFSAAVAAMPGIFLQRIIAAIDSAVKSGTPWAEVSGEVIGIVSAKLDEKYEGINFAIPMSEYMDFFNSEIEKDMSKPQLGVVGFSVE